MRNGNPRLPRRMGRRRSVCSLPMRNGNSKEGWSDEEICKKLGMELDEVLRLKQISGLKEAFANHEFSKSWEEFERKYYPNEK